MGAAWGAGTSGRAWDRGRAVLGNAEQGWAVQSRVGQRRPGWGKRSGKTVESRGKIRGREGQDREQGQELEHGAVGGAWQWGRVRLAGRGRAAQNKGGHGENRAARSEQGRAGQR